MEIYVGIVVGVLAVEVLGITYWLGSGKIPERDPVSLGWTLVIDGALLVWGAVVFAGHLQ